MQPSKMNELTRSKVHVPESCLGQEIVIGIDEAGRGPVLGSLIYCAAFWPLSLHDEICRLGFDDSKQLKEGERDRLFKRIRDHGSIGWVIEELTAEKISVDMNRMHPISLNTISYDAVVRMLETIRDCNPNPPIIENIYVDTVGDPEFYKSRLVAALGADFAKFTIEKKADATYKVVSAASIIAKVSRDRLLLDWKFEEQGLVLDQQFGSGYPGDPACVSWMARSCHPVFGYPSLVRSSWATSREALKVAGAAKVHWECEDDEDQQGSANITSFFNGAGDKRPKRAAFFSSRKLKQVSQSRDGI